MKSKPSTIFSSWLSAIVFLAIISANANAASSPSLQVLHSFTGGTDGTSPTTSLVSDAEGNLYGVTASGGNNTSCLTGQVGCGVVYELSPPTALGGKWTEVVLYRFTGGADGAAPQGPLVLDQSGNLIGTTNLGGDLNDSNCSNGRNNIGCGVVFELSQSGGSWMEKVIYTFEGGADGAFPIGNLLFDLQGNLYGTTEAGGVGRGCGGGCGTVFELTPSGLSGSWIETQLYEFLGSPDGAVPLAGLTIDPTGNLYGTTQAGGLIGEGTVFKLAPSGVRDASWSEEILFSFNADAGQPRSGVIMDQLGNLYGTTGSGNGTAFELMPSGGDNWSESTIHTFGNGHSAMPWAGLISDDVRNLYGATIGMFCGSIFRLQNHGGSWNEAEVDLFSGHQGPCEPEAALVFGKWGAAYGTTVKGGTCKGRDACGTVFGILR